MKRNPIASTINLKPLSSKACRASAPVRNIFFLVLVLLILFQLASSASVLSVTFAHRGFRTSNPSITSGIEKINTTGGSRLMPNAAQERAANFAFGFLIPKPLSHFLLPILSAPTNLNTTSASSTSLNLSWTASAGAVSYRIERSTSLSQPFTLIASSTTTTFSDVPASGVNTYLYRVRAVDGSGAASQPSNIAFATVITFTDATIIPGVTVVRGQHLRELREVVNAVRRAADLPDASWSDPTPEGVSIRATHIQQLRDRLDEALTALSVPVTSYMDPILSTGINGTPIRHQHIEELRSRSTRGSSTASGPSDGGSTSSARLDPMNQTGGGGENPLSRNFNWSIPLVGLKGRAGLDLGLSLSYNSLVWTKSGSSISFDDDQGFPAPGFRLGFPVVQPAFYNSEAGKYAFMLITPDGGHTEMRQVGTSTLYQATDSSYLTFDSSTMTLRATDGTQLLYAWTGSDYQCIQIKDSNGNFLSVSYTTSGYIDSIVDTLSRIIKFNYSADNRLTSITHNWTADGQTQSQPHTWASFDYGTSDLTIQTNFSGLIVTGPQNGTPLKVLTRVTLDNNSRFDFDYTSWGQVWKVTNYASDGHLLNYRAYNLPGSPLLATSAQTDCPRFTERHDWAENWNRSGPAGLSGLPSGNEQEIVTLYAVPAVASWMLPDGTIQTGTAAQVKMPDQSFQNIYFNGTANSLSGWHRSLPSLVNAYDKDGNLQRQSVTTWTQDDTNVSYQINPRVSETHIYDPSGNHKRTRITYHSVSFGDGTSCQLPQDVYEYQGDATTVLRRTHTEHNLAAAYTSRRLIGLVSEKTLYEVNPNTSAETLMSKVGFEYDEAGSIEGTDAPVQHDNTNYGATFIVGRGNLTSVKRYDIYNTSQFTASGSKYNTAGAVVSTTDPVNHEVRISYTDSFSNASKNSLNTLAYPTTITVPGGSTSRSKYNYDFGGVTWTQTPMPNVTDNQPGPEQTFIYDSLGRIQKVTQLTNNTYTRYEYPSSGNRVDTYATVQENMGEAHSFSLIDGMGRIIATASDHPGSMGGFSGQLTLYDVRGQAVKKSNPTETTASGNPTGWAASGDDATANGGAGWVYTQQAYDWKGRPTLTINPDASTKELSYDGCGCAGGEVITTKDEVGRSQRVISDILGRASKSEVLNWDGTVYSTIINTYNARDQIINTKHYQGTDASGVYQESVMTYDGHGRLQTSKVPEQTSDTSYTYNPDDTTNTVTDASGATTTFSYNSRHLATSITYAAPEGIIQSAPVSFSYDAAGNRTGMTDGLGSISYQYDQLSRLISETRSFTGVGSFTLSYGYNLAGDLTSITDPSGAQIGYSYDRTGRLSAVTGTGGSVSSYAANIQYRAWGAVKGLTYGNGHVLTTDYNNRMQTTRFQIKSSVGTVLMGMEYQYTSQAANNQNNDGRVKYARDLMQGQLDRFYKYDHAGRLSQGLTGFEARYMRDYGQENWSNIDGPYWQVYGYDVWDNLNTRVWRGWESYPADPGRFNPVREYYLASYVDGRNTAWQYDAEGRPISTNSLGDVFTYAYDSAGRLASTTKPGGSGSLFYDGDGQKVKQIESGTITYYVRSSALDGLVIVELNGSGALLRSYVYANDDEPLVMQENNQARWYYRDPINSKIATAGANGGEFLGKVEFDPLGVRVDDDWARYSMGNHSPRPVFGVDQFYERLFGRPRDPSMACYADGAQRPCQLVMGWLNTGSALRCPDNVCNRFNWNTRQFERYGTEGWRALDPSGGWTQGIGVVDARTGAGWFKRRRNSERWQSQQPTPQNTPLTPNELERLRSDMKWLLEKKTCNDFVTGILATLNQSVTSPHENTLDLFAVFQTVLGEGGFVKVSPMDRAANTLTSSYPDGRVHRQIGIDPQSSTYKNLNDLSPGAVSGRGVTTIHELIHGAGRGSFTHSRIAQAARTVALSLGLSRVGELPDSRNFPESNEGRTAFDNASSRYFQDILIRACFRWK